MPRADGRLRAARVAAGLAPSPAKVTVTASGQIDPASRFCTAGDAERVVDAATSAVAATRRRLMVEGGGGVLTQVLTAGLSRTSRCYALSERFRLDPDAPQPQTGALAVGSGVGG